MNLKLLKFANSAISFSFCTESAFQFCCHSVWNQSPNCWSIQNLSLLHIPQFISCSTPNLFFQFCHQSAENKSARKRLTLYWWIESCWSLQILEFLFCSTLNLFFSFVINQFKTNHLIVDQFKIDTFCTFGNLFPVQCQICFSVLSSISWK